MVTYRGKLDIAADILNVVSRKPKKTQIMFQANLSYQVLQKYLTELTGASLICFEGEHQCYSLTIKGQQFLDAYRKYLKTHKYVEKALNDINGKKAELEKLFDH